MSVEPVEKVNVLRLLRQGEELIMVDFDRLIIRNVYGENFPFLEKRIESKNVFFYIRSDDDA